MIHDTVFPMHNRGKDGLLDTRLENFLYSVLGSNDSDTPLTVISALARRGCDPWNEAARLSALPKANAAEALTLMVGSIPPMWCKLPDEQATVARLLKLLPRAEPKVRVSQSRFAEFKERHKVALLPIVCVALFAVVLAGYLFR